MHGGELTPALTEMLAKSDDTFAGVLLMHYPSEGLDHVKFLPRQGTSLGLNVGIESFYESVQTISKEVMVMSVTPAEATEDWLFEQSAYGYETRRIRPLSIGSRYITVAGLGKTMMEVAKHPKLREYLEAAITRLNAEQQMPNL